MHGVADLVTSAAAECPDKLALVEDGGRSLTWAQLEDEVARVATGLSLAGVVAGYRVAVVMENRIELVTTYLGTLRARAVAVPLNPRGTPDEVLRVLADSGARVVVADAPALPTVREAVDRLSRALAGEEGLVDADLLVRAVAPRVVVVGAGQRPGERSYDALRATPPQRVPSVPDPDALATLLYTSGTSGRPRAAMLSHRALAANVEQVARVEPPMLRGDDVVLGVLPLFHVYGLNAVLGGVLRQRAKLVLTDHFDPSGTLDLLEDEACSVVPVAPAVFGHWLADEDLSERLGSVTSVLSGSAPLAAATVEEFEAATGVPVHQGYGLTEAAPVVTSTLCSADPAPGSVGSPLPGIELRLVDEAGRPAEPGDPGEIEIRGENLFDGYWPDAADGPRDDGWWATGDVGLLDERGDLVLVDRVKELVVVSGFNVYPVEVEEVLRELPAVADAAVIGVDDPATGEAVVAFLRPVDDGAVADEEARAELARTALEHCAGRLARFKQPRRVEVVEQLPRTLTGKVQKGRLRGLERRRALGLLE